MARWKGRQGDPEADELVVSPPVTQVGYVTDEMSVLLEADGSGIFSAESDRDVEALAAAGITVEVLDA